jgi:glycosyltransferase involved in cell wall biosynthesis
MAVVSLEAPLHAVSQRASAPEAIAIMIGQLTPQGGSERQLYLFLAACDRDRWAPVVYVSGALGSWEGRIRKLGIPVVLLRGHPLVKMWRFRAAAMAQNATCFFSWSSYTNGFGLALTGHHARRIGSFRNATFADLPTQYGWLWRWMSMAGVSTFVCNSRETKTQFASHRGSRKEVLYVPNAVEMFGLEQLSSWRAEWRAQFGLRDDAVLVLGVGRLAQQKQFARFIDVVARVRRQLPVQAVIAGGDQGCQADLEAQTARLGLQEAIRFLGKVPDAHELMSAGDIFLLSSDHEGMPNVVLEAMAAGVPCVATRVNGVGDLIHHGETGFVAAHDVDELAQHVIRLAEDAELRRAMGARARAAIALSYRQDDILRQLWMLCESRDASARK